MYAFARVCVLALLEVHEGEVAVLVVRAEGSRGNLAGLIVYGVYVVIGLCVVCCWLSCYCVLFDV